MALTESGQLSLGDISIEMGVSPSNVSLTTQSTTDINTNSESKPDGSTPHAISEFYGYDHSASPPLTGFNVDENRWGDPAEACMSGTVRTEWYHDGEGEYPTTDDTVYTDSDGTTNPDDGYYFMENNSVIEITSGVVTNEGNC